MLDAIPGLVSAGTVVVGMVLLVTALAAPTVLERAGLGLADGPGWSRVPASCGFGVIGELVVRPRRAGRRRAGGGGRGGDRRLCRRHLVGVVALGVNSLSHPCSNGISTTSIRRGFPPQGSARRPG